MTIFLKNKHTLQIDDFYFNCCIGKNGVTRRKKEGDYKTPAGIFNIGKLFFRKDRIKKPKTSLPVIEIKQSMGWCDDISHPSKYNRLIKISNKVKHEKLRRNDNKYDLLIPISYNRKNPKRIPRNRKHQNQQRPPKHNNHLIFRIPTHRKHHKHLKRIKQKIRHQLDRIRSQRGHR